MTAGLLEALTALTGALPAAHTLIPQPDTDGTSSGHGKPGSRPPWNTNAAAAFFDAYQGIRRLHVMFHAEVTGRPLTHCATSAHSTGAHLRAVAALAVNVSPASTQEATRMTCAWTARIRQHPAIDTDERWQRVAGAACYHCHAPMLRLAPRSGRVTCLRFGACYDCGGQHPMGFVRRGLDGEPLVEWQDGCLQYGTAVSA